MSSRLCQDDQSCSVSFRQVHFLEIENPRDVVACGNGNLIILARRYNIVQTILHSNACRYHFIGHLS